MTQDINERLASEVRYNERLRGELWQARNELDHWKSKAYQNLAALSTRTTDQIRDEALIRFNALAGRKYDKGQEEHGGNLDSHPDLIGALQEESIDIWMYLEALARQIEGKDRKIAELQYNLKKVSVAGGLSGEALKSLLEDEQKE